MTQSAHALLADGVIFLKNKRHTLRPGSLPLRHAGDGVNTPRRYDTKFEENWSFSPGTAAAQLRFDAPKTQTVIGEQGLRGPRC